MNKQSLFHRNKQEALKLLHSNMQNQNLRRHCYAVGAVMRALALYIKNQKLPARSAFSTADAGGKIKNTNENEKINKFVSNEVDEDKWEIVGLLHDGDYEQTKDTPETHTLLMHQWLKEKGADKEILNAILSHNYAHTGNHAPSNKMEWSLYCCDELTGLIVAVALVRPGKKLGSVRVDSIMKKWGEKSFAAGVDRKQIEECEEKLGIPLKEFVGIALSAMQEVSSQLGL